MKLTWFGHSAFRVDLPGAVIMIDPFLKNPTFEQQHKTSDYEGTTHVLLTHGHDDHIGSTAEICEETGATLIANPEICDFLGIEPQERMNHGGTVDLGAFTVSFVPAWHSSAVKVNGSLVYLGNPAGAVITAKGEPTLLHMGDTGIFGDMQLIGGLYEPKIGIVPIGDRFTMGPKLAALACKRYFDFETVIPAHYGTFGLLKPDADEFLSEMKNEKAKVLVPERGVAVEV